MDENTRKYLSKIGQIGGKKTAKVWGISHFSKIGKRGARKRHNKRDIKPLDKRIAMEYTDNIKVGN